LEAAGRLATKHGDHDAAQAFLTAAVALARAHDDRPGLAAGTHSLGCLARRREEYGAAATLLREARALFRELGDANRVAETAVCLGMVTALQGELVAARALFEESVTLYRRLGNRQGIAVSLSNLGNVALEQGDLAAARALAQESLVLANEIGDRERVAIALAALAGVAAAHGTPALALRLAGGAFSIREALGKSSPASWRARFDRWLEPARRALSAEACAAAEAAGRAMPLDEAIEYALASDASATGALTPALVEASGAGVAIGGELPDGSPSEQALSVLTPRELEVAALVARGLTNHQIADALAISPTTATSHVKHILARLDLDSRVQIAIWAIERGLHGRPAA
jgi:DNA-binding CsgD family transcriptional regulator